MSFFFFLLFLFGLARRTSLEGGGGGGGGCSKSSEERAWSVGKNENNFVGCDRERVKSKGRRKNMKHAKVTTNLKKK